MFLLVSATMREVFPHSLPIVWRFAIDPKPASDNLLPVDRIWLLVAIPLLKLQATSTWCVCCLLPPAPSILFRALLPERSSSVREFSTNPSNSGIWSLYKLVHAHFLKGACEHDFQLLLYCHTFSLGRILADECPVSTELRTCSCRTPGRFEFQFESECHLLV